MMDNKHIAIVGNIGAGKTSLTEKLAAAIGWTPHFENPDTNPYISDFYSDMRRWSFNMQMHFLFSRIEKIQEIRSSGMHVIQDRTIYEDVYVFAPNLYAMGLMDSRDFDCYTNLYEQIASFIQPPDLLIYLKAPVQTLVEHIKARNREYEQHIRSTYIQSLNDRYDEWIAAYTLGPLLIYDVSKMNFIDSAHDFQVVLESVKKIFSI